MRRYLLCLCFGLMILLLASGPAISAESPDLRIEPNHLDVNTFFTGGEVTITGRAPAQADVVVEITGPMVDAQYDIKGRVGPFWMNRQKVHLKNTPSLYALLTPDGEKWEERLSALGVGFEKLKDSIQVSDSEISKADIVQMFMKLKESEGLYGEDFGAVTYGSEKDGVKTFTADYKFPSSTLTGSYAIKAVLVENGATQSESFAKLSVREIGFIKFIDKLASNQRLVYGVLAVVIALFTGAIMGVLFKGGGGH
jgi:uncharacterized protein (TIGR02186 family)